MNCPKNIRKIKIEGILKSVEERAIYALERINGTYTAIIKDSFWDALGKAIPPFSLFGWLDIFSIQYVFLIIILIVIFIFFLKTIKAYSPFGILLTLLKKEKKYIPKNRNL